MSSQASTKRQRSWTISPIAVAATLLGIATIAASTRAYAETQVRGGREAVSIEAHDCTLDDLLTALGRAYGVKWHSPMKLETRVTGTYQGPLPRVLARILQGYDFVVESEEGRTEVVILGARSPSGNGSGAGSPLGGQRPTFARGTSSAAMPQAVNGKSASPVAVGREPQAPNVLHGATPIEAERIAGVELPKPWVPGMAPAPVPDQLPATLTLKPSAEPATPPMPLSMSQPPPMPLVTNSTNISSEASGTSGSGILEK